MSAIPVITRPVRGGHISLSNDGAQTPPAFLGGPFSPVGLVQPSSVKTPSSIVQLVPRAPVVHFFVCDFANAKVKTFSEQFIEQLTQNGVKVYTERFMTHQPGFQVRAASLNTTADFFFQIHSKTAGRGDVRLYLNGQPRRMTREEGVAEVWAWWRLKSGALSREEVDVISGEKMAWLLKEFADVDCEAMALDELQRSLRDAIEMRTELRSVLDRLREIEGALVNGKMKVATMRNMSTDWNREPGGQLSRCLAIPVVCGLSPPLRELLDVVLDESLVKVQGLIAIAERESVNVVEEVDDHGAEVPIEGTSAHDDSAWRMMIESVDDDHMGSWRIASYGDVATPGDSFGKTLNVAPFQLDEY